MDEFPVFIVGMHRSGTKLLRELVNNSPEVSIPPAESIFIPQFIDAWGGKDKVLGGDDLGKVYEALSRTTYFINLASAGCHLSADTFQEINLPGTRLKDVLANTIKYFSFQRKPGAVVWGDKSPYYRKFIPLLKDTYPNARFIHIIRDPRDMALSAKKAWGRSLLRAAHDWQNDVEKAREDGALLGEDYFELTYEDLVQSPKEMLRQVYAFMGVEFQEAYLTLNHPVEDLGDTAGITRLLSDNIEKHKKELPAAKIKRINQITLPQAKALGYVTDANITYLPLSSLHLALLRYYDSTKSLLFHLKDKGLYKGFSYTLRLKMTRVNSGKLNS